MASREVQAILAYVESSGLPYRVTDVNGPGHTAGSYHYAKGTGGDGLAVDFAGVIPGVTAVTEVQMAAIYRAFLDVAHQLAELIYSGAGVTHAIKNGKRVDGQTYYGPLTWADHRDHVHVAVPRGIFLTPLSHPLRTMEVVMADDPNLPNINGPATFHPVINTTTGECTGYYIFSPETVELHSFGPGAKWYGRSEDLTPG